MGKSDRQPTPLELKEMKVLVQKEMDQGAFGMSTGLFYAPGSYANTTEVIELAKIVAMNDGIYDTHLRDESSFTVGLVSAVQEALEIGEKAQIPIHISHIKCLGKDVWGKSQEVIGLIEKAKTMGVRVTANQYPYEASATSLKAAVVPRWAESGGLDSLFILGINGAIFISIISLLSILYIKGCFGVAYVSLHKYPQPFFLVQKKFRSLRIKKLIFALLINFF